MSNTNNDDENKPIERKKIKLPQNTVVSQNGEDKVPIYSFKAGQIINLPLIDEDVEPAPVNSTIPTLLEDTTPDSTCNMDITNSDIESTVFNSIFWEAKSKKSKNRKNTEDLLKDEEDKKLLEECETKIFEKSMIDFVEVCDAISIIVERKLYKKKYDRFDDYCEKHLGLKVCNAYLKIRISKVYKNVCNCTYIKPTNEYQMRELMKIRSEEMQQIAWKIVVNNLRNGQNIPKVEDIKKIVIQINNKDYIIQNSPKWTEKITIENNFNTILVRWNILFGTFHRKDIKYCSRIFKRFLTKYSNRDIDNNVKRTTVLVDALEAYLTSSTLESELKLLLQMCQSIPDYNFLLWTSRIEVLRQWQGHDFLKNWPSNVSLAYKINTFSDASALSFDIAKKLPLDTIWLTPEEPIIFEKLSNNICRVLVGDTNWLHGKSNDTIIMLRKVIGNILLNNNIIIDIEKETQKIFYML